MSETELKHIHQDLELMKQDLALIKHILIEEGELSAETQVRLAQARKTSLSEYEKL